MLVNCTDRTRRHKVTLNAPMVNRDVVIELVLLCRTDRDSKAIEKVTKYRNAALTSMSALRSLRIKAQI